MDELTLAYVLALIFLLGLIYYKKKYEKVIEENQDILKHIDRISKKKNLTFKNKLIQ